MFDIFNKNVCRAQLLVFSICLVFSEIYNSFVSIAKLLQEWCPCNTCHGPFNFIEKGQAFANPKPIPRQNQIGSNPAPIQDQKLSKTKSCHLVRNIWFGVALDSLFDHLGDISVNHYFYFGPSSDPNQDQIDSKLKPKWLQSNTKSKPNPIQTCAPSLIWKGNPFCMWPSDLLKVFVIRDLQRSLRFYQNIKWSSFCFQQIESPHIKAIKVCRHPLIRTTLSTYILMWWWQRA